MKKNLYRLDGKYGVRFQYKDQAGKKRLFRRMTGAKNLREAEGIRDRWMREVQLFGHVREFEQAKQDPNTRKSTITFSGFAKRWLENYVIPNNGRNEQIAKDSHLRVHLAPFFGDVDIRDIDAEMIDRFKAVMVQKMKQGPPKAKEPRKDGKPISKNSINKHLGTLRKLLNTAVEWGYLDKAPKVEAFKIVQPDPDWYTLEERELFLATCQKYRPEWHCFFLLAFHTGARMGELAGLKWEDVQFATRIIRISRTRDREGNEGPPKGRKSRTVPMNSKVYEALKAHQHLDGPYVFHNSAGKKLDVNAGYKSFKWICRKAGLRALRRHDLRHTFASNVVAETGNIVAVQDILGHADLTTTRRYSHLAPVQHLDVVESIVLPSPDVPERSELKAVGDEQNSAHPQSEGETGRPEGGGVLSISRKQEVVRKRSDRK